MIPAIWSAIALVAALSMGTLYLLSRIDSLASAIDARFDRVDDRFDRRDDRFAHLEQRLDTHIGRHAG